MNPENNVYICAYGCGEVDEFHMHVMPRPQEPGDPMIEEFHREWEGWHLAAKHGMSSAEWEQTDGY